jgi:hypothetical protein
VVNENASLVKYEPPKCDECGRKIIVLSDLCAKCAAGIELNAPSARPNGEQVETLALRPLNEQDKAAFENFWSRLPGVENGFEKSLAEVSWQGCLAYLNKQAEPVANPDCWQCGGDGCYWCCDETHPAPAVAQEPVLKATGIHTEQDGKLYQFCEVLSALMPNPGTQLYTEAPAGAVNEKLKMALMMFLCAHDHPNANTTKEAVRCANEALGLIEAAKGGV